MRYAKRRSSKPSRTSESKAHGPAGSSPCTPAASAISRAPAAGARSAGRSATSSVRGAPTQATSRRPTPDARRLFQARVKSLYERSAALTPPLDRSGPAQTEASRPQQRLEFVRGQRLRVVVALLLVAAQAAHERGLRSALDPFCH